MIEVKEVFVYAKTSLREALRRLDETGEGMLLLVDDAGKLARTVTDGDIRRLLLAGASMDDSLSRLPLIESVTVSEGETENAALKLMNECQIDHLPVINSHGRPTSVFLRRDLDKRILLSTPHIGEHEMGYVEEAFRTNWVAPVGPNVDAFEREIAAHVGIGHAAAVSSGTAALHLALRLLDVRVGDKVFCSSLTFVASANPILYQGATPVFIDSDPDSWNMSPRALERGLRDARAAGQLPKAVIVVNLYGQSADMDPISEICDHYNVPVVEDAAESLGATYKDRASGTLGSLGVYSFNGNKIITTSGGGMLVSEDLRLIEKARSLSMQARDPAPWYEHSELGYNYRMSNILAGIGRGQLRVLKQRVEARRAVFKRYSDGLSHVSALNWMPEASFGRSTRWLTVATLDKGFNPTAVVAKLASAGIEARPVWKPMHRQPLFQDCGYYPFDSERSFSDEAFSKGICLPSGSNMLPEEQDRIIATIDAIFTERIYSKRM